jgi:hypothetical protein
MISFVIAIHRESEEAGFYYFMMILIAIDLGHA